MSVTPGRRPPRRKGYAAPPKVPSLRGFAVSAGDGHKDRVFRLSRAEERSLIAAARRGDAQALSRLLTLLSGPIYRFGRGFCGDPHDAEDVAQNVLIALSRTLRDFRGDSSLTTWAYTVARHACARQRRRRAGAPARLDSLEASEPDRGALGVEDPRQDPHRSLERARLAEAIEHAIRALPIAQREVLVLRDVEGLPAAEVARTLGTTERAVKARLHRARVALRATLAPWAAGSARPRRRAQPEAAGAASERCPDTVRLVSRYLEGELSAETCDQLYRHVSACPDCGAACEALREMLGACRALRGQPVPTELRISVRRALRDLLDSPDARG